MLLTFYVLSDAVFFFFFLYYCHKAREKEQKEAVNKEPATSDTATTSQTTATRHDKTSRDDDTGETSNSHFSNFPLLPLPPREYHYYRHTNQHGIRPTEDKMGTLHNAIIDTNQQPLQSSSSSQTSSHKERDTEHRLASNQPPAVRFVPRTTHLESRKRKTEEAAEHSLTDVPRSNEPLIGPKLPEPAKLDMEDVSLNTTVSLIRNTMKQVVCKFRKHKFFTALQIPSFVSLK